MLHMADDKANWVLSYLCNINWCHCRQMILASTLTIHVKSADWTSRLLPRIMPITRESLELDSKIKMKNLSPKRQPVHHHFLHLRTLGWPIAVFIFQISVNGKERQGKPSWSEISRPRNLVHKTTPSRESPVEMFPELHAITFCIFS